VGRPRPWNVLFLCTANSARSILAEHLLRARAGDRFATWSAGSQPRGVVNPHALAVLAQDYGIDTRDARSKSIEDVGDVPFDLVVTLCDDARESCPLPPPGALLVHWGMPDPAAVAGDDADRRSAFRDAARTIERRLSALCALPLETLATPARRAALEAIADR